MSPCARDDGEGEEVGAAGEEGGEGAQVGGAEVEDEVEELGGQGRKGWRTGIGLVTSRGRGERRTWASTASEAVEAGRVQEA